MLPLAAAPQPEFPSPAALLPPRTAAAHSDDYLYSQLIPYIGNKRKLLPLIQQALSRTAIAPGETFVDLFAGSGVVSRLAKRMGCRVIANDWEPYAFEISHCFAVLNHSPAFAKLGGAVMVVDVLNKLPSLPDGYIARHLCPAIDDFPDPSRERLFFTRSNGGRIDAMREQIDKWERAGLIDPTERSYLLAPLLFAASYVSNTSGLFKAFHNGWGGRTGTALYRILSDLRLRAPVLSDNGLQNEAWQLDAQTAAERLNIGGVRPEVVYLDPPYNQHPYGSNYHLLNTISLWDKPPLSASVALGEKSAIRTDWRTKRRSAYNSRRDAAAAYAKLLGTLHARYILTSYSTDGTIPLQTLLELSARAGQLSCVLEPYKRYRVSSQRRSRKPINVEFVLIIDCSRPGLSSDAQACADMILREERAALSRHAESAGNAAGFG